ncbi:MAG: malonyl-CoA decarboxylase family protein, partial [Pseudomonadota bacterium]
RGISFGAFLIKQVASDLMKELPNLATFVTLSPVPGFADWLNAEAARAPSVVDVEVRAVMASLAETEDWLADEPLAKSAEAALSPLLAHYLTAARDEAARVVDPVARFHLGNGARLERLNFAADRSPRGLSRAHGFMVNYRYILDEVEKNHELFVGEGRVVAQPAIVKLAQRVKLTGTEGEALPQAGPAVAETSAAET